MIAKPSTTSTVSFDDKGNIKEVKNTINYPIYIYILLSNNIPVYVGKTKNIAQRMKSHSLRLEFDRYLIVGSYYIEEQAVTAERAVISSMFFFNKRLLNKSTKGNRYLFTKTGKGLK